MKSLRKENTMCFRTKVSLLLFALFVGAGVLGFNVTQDVSAYNDSDDAVTAVASEEAGAVALDKTANLFKLVEKLKAQISGLQAKLKAARHGATDSAEWCHTFNRDLKYGNAGAEVRALQIALKKQGFTGASRDKIGRFGVYTASAVVGFQERYRKIILDPLELKHGTGFVGELTRAKLNKLYGCGITPVPPVPDDVPDVPDDVPDIPDDVPPTPSVEKCSDSDGGIEKYVRGRTCRNLYFLKDSNSSDISVDNFSDPSTSTNSGSSKRFCRTDRCVALPSILEKISAIGGINALSRDYVKEYYCRNGKIFSKIMRCENGCKNGACIKEIEELTCAAKCEAEGYDKGICRTWTIIPDAVAGCEGGELNVGQTSDCSVPSGLVGASKTCCCQNEPQEDTTQ